MERIRGTVKGRKIPLKTLHRKRAEHFTTFFRSNKTHTGRCKMYRFCQTMHIFKNLTLKNPFFNCIIAEELFDSNG